MRSLLNIFFVIIIIYITLGTCFASTDYGYEEYLELSKKADKSLNCMMAVYNYPYDVGSCIEWDGEIVGNYGYELYIETSGNIWICWVSEETLKYLEGVNYITVIGTIFGDGEIKNKYGKPVAEAIIIYPSYIEKYNVVFSYREKYKHLKEIDNAMISRKSSYESAKIYFDIGKYHNALEKLKSALDTLHLEEETILPSREDVLLLKANCEFKLKDYESALDTISDIEKIDQINIEANVLEKTIFEVRYNESYSVLYPEIERLKSEKENYLMPSFLNLIIPSYKSNWSKQNKTAIILGTYGCITGYFIFDYFSDYYKEEMEKYPQGFWERENCDNMRKMFLSFSIFSISAAVGFEIWGYYVSFRDLKVRNKDRDIQIEEKSKYLESIKP